MLGSVSVTTTLAFSGEFALSVELSRKAALLTRDEVDVMTLLSTSASVPEFTTLTVIAYGA